MDNDLQDISVKFFEEEMEEADWLARLFAKETTPGSTAVVNRCAIWGKAKRLSQRPFEYFVAASGVRMPSKYSFVLDTMSSRYSRLNDALGPVARSGAVLAMISMFADDSFNGAILSLQSRSELDADQLLEQIANAAWATHKKKPT